MRLEAETTPGRSGLTAERLHLVRFCWHTAEAVERLARQRLLRTQAAAGEDGLLREALEARLLLQAATLSAVRLRLLLTREAAQATTSAFQDMVPRTAAEQVVVL